MTRVHCGGLVGAARIGVCAALLALAACNTSSSSSTDLCAVEATLDMSEAAAGDTVVATGKPFTTAPDTAVRVGGVAADDIVVERSEDCVLCDACLDGANCTGCEASCSDCDAICETCVQTVSFTVPAAAPGDAPVVLQNRYGATDPIAFSVLGDTADTGYTGSRRRSRTRGFRLPFTSSRETTP